MQRAPSKTVENACTPDNAMFMPAIPLEEMAFGPTIKKCLNDSLSSNARCYRSWLLDFKK